MTVKLCPRTTWPGVTQVGQAQWQGLSLSAAVTQSRANTLGKAERNGWPRGQKPLETQCKSGLAVSGQGPTDHSQPSALPLLYAHAVEKTHTQNSAVTCSEHVPSASCRTQADRALQWITSFFFSTAWNGYGQILWRSRSDECWISAENAQGLRNPGVSWESRIQDWSTSVEPISNRAKVGWCTTLDLLPPWLSHVTCRCS